MKPQSPPVKFVILCVLDGWGIAPPGKGNAITQAKLPNMSRLMLMYPHTQLGASGESVGLPRGEAGNTETGHLNLGAGKIIYQDLARINLAIADGSLFQNQVLLGAIDHAKRNNSRLHIMGLIGAGGVHSNIEHLFALIQLARQQQFKDVYLHLFTDGRDSPPTSAATYINQIQEVLAREQIGTIASIMGRYWAMDRDQRWNRTEKAYVALTAGVGHLVKTSQEAIELAYQSGKTDEFIEPSIITDSGGVPLALIKPNDAAIFFNFRIDRPRQLTKAFVLSDFSTANLDTNLDFHTTEKRQKQAAHGATAPSPLFERGEKIPNLYFVTMTEYSKLLSGMTHVAFPPEIVTMPLGRIIAEHDLHQLRVSESEKERFVTFYFNGQQEIVFPNEDRLIIASPKVPTYDQQPEMSAREITKQVIEKITNHPNYSFILINFANADMVGHTGNLPATITACEVVDECIGKLANFVLANEGAMLITADHGNAEEMINLATNDIDTEHSKFPVPFIAIGKQFQGKASMLPTGILADIAPTVLSLLSVPAPENMMGRNLLATVGESF